jgi:hypothetical protein
VQCYVGDLLALQRREGAPAGPSHLPNLYLRFSTKEQQNQYTVELGYYTFYYESPHYDVNLVSLM